MKQAMILAGGTGSRMLPLTQNMPKPMLPVNGKPLIQHTIEYLMAHKCYHIVVNVAYMKHKLISFLKDLDYAIDIDIVEESDPSGSAGAILKARKHFTKDFIVINGDILTNMDIDKLWEFHQEKNSIATMALTEMDDVTQFGVVIRDENKLITQFQEKPPLGTELSKCINTGIYVFSPLIFDYISEEKEITDLAFDIFPNLMGKSLYGLELPGAYWKDIGRISDYEEVNRNFPEALMA